MQALGGDWNAFTSNADTTFVIEAPAKNQRKVLDLLLALLTQTRFDDSAILRPSWRAFLLRLEANTRARGPWALPPPMKIGGCGCCIGFG